MVRTTKRYIAVIILAGAAFLFMSSIPSGDPVPLKSDLALFPAAVGGLTGEDAPAATEGLPSGTDGFMYRKYGGTDGKAARLYLYVGYWGKFRHGADVFSGDFVDPGYLWDPVKERDVSIDAAGKGFRAREVIYSKGDYRISIIYWYQTIHGVTTKRFRGRLGYGIDAMLNRRTNVALVKISSAAFRAGSDSPLAVQRRFAGEVFYALKGFLPFDD
ncbi:MAG: EpsI family protein [Nitrospirae bacterium]|nr:EpsI family protein [Nitrospirota bacterium]